MHILSPLTSKGSGCIFWTRPNESKWLSCHFGISVRVAWCFGLPTVFQDMVTAAGICLRCMTYGSEETCGHAARARACPILLSTWAPKRAPNTGACDMSFRKATSHEFQLHSHSSTMFSHYVIIMSQFNPIQHISIYFHNYCHCITMISTGSGDFPNFCRTQPAPPWGTLRTYADQPATVRELLAALANCASMKSIKDGRGEERFVAGRFRTDFDITIPKRLKPIKSDATDCDEVVFSICLGVTKGPTICWYYCSVLVVWFIASTVPPAGRLSIGPSPKCRSDLPRHGAVVRSGTWRAGARVPSLRGVVPLMLSGLSQGGAPNLWHFFWSGTGYNREFGGPNFEITSHTPPWG